MRYIGVFLLYVLAGKLGLMLAVVHESATAVWAPSGIALAALLLIGLRMWPAVFAGAFVVNVTTAGGVTSSLFLAAGNTLEGVVAAALVMRFAGGRDCFQHPQDIFKFAGAAVLASTIAATFGATTLTGMRYALYSEYPPIWLTWWLGDATGILILTPALVLWYLERGAMWRRTWVEAALASVAVAAASFLIFGTGSPESRYPLTFLAVPPLMWVAFRFGTRAAATAVLGMCAVAIWGTQQGLGPFATFEPRASLLFLQGFMATMAMLIVPMAAMEARIMALGAAVQRLTTEQATIVEKTTPRRGRRDR